MRADSTRKPPKSLPTTAERTARSQKRTTTTGATRGQRPRRTRSSRRLFLRAAPRRSTGSTRGFAELGYAMLYSKQLDGALAEYVQALALNPNDSDIITEYGDALNYAGPPDQAVELFQKAMRLNPYFPDWYL